MEGWAMYRMWMRGNGTISKATFTDSTQLAGEKTPNQIVLPCIRCLFFLKATDPSYENERYGKEKFYPLRHSFNPPLWLGVLCLY